MMFSSGSCGETGRLEDWLGGLQAWNDPSALVDGMSKDLLSIPVKESVCGCVYWGANVCVNVGVRVNGGPPEVGHC